MSPVEYTSIHIFGILIEEPMTTLTDLLTASVCYYSFFMLHKLGNTDRGSVFLKYYFLFMGLGTTCAAFLSHGILYWSGYNWKTLGWTLSAIGLLCMENGALAFYQKEKKANVLNWLKYVFIAQLIIFVLVIANPSTRVFQVVKINSTIAMMLINLPFFAYLYYQTKGKGYKMVFWALLTTVIPGITFSAEWTLHKYFNYHDISHVLMAICSFLIFKGAYQLSMEQKQEKLVKPQTMAI